jgi:hypothetical protein
MVYKNTLEAIIEHVKEINTMVSGFTNNDKISAIEMDLTLEKVRNLYDILLMLKQSNLREESKIKKPVPGTETGSVESDKAGGVNGLPGTETDSDIKDTRNSIEYEESAKSDLTENKSAKADNNEEIISDRFKSQTASIHDGFLKSQKYEDLSSKLKSKPITNIADAIGINDKFIFIKELFNGNENKYNKTIEVLNNATNFNDAYNYLMGNFNWDMDNSLVQILLDLIRRKLIINKDE